MASNRVDSSRFGHLGVNGDERPTLDVWLRRPESKLDQILPWLQEQMGEAPVAAVLTTVETEVKYAGYMQQQDRQVQRLRDAEGRPIPQGFDFRAISGLSREICDKLERVRPVTLGRASRIPGVTPAAIAILDIYLSLNRR